MKDLKNNLLSIGQLDDLGCKIHVEGGILKVVKGNLVVMKAKNIMSTLYVLMGDTLKEANATVALTSPEEASLTWHRRLRRMSEQGMQIHAKRNLLSRIKKVDLPLCKHCVISKQHRLKFARMTTKSKHILDLIHSDVKESPKVSLGGKKLLCIVY